MQFPLIGEAYTMPSLALDAQTCVNWFMVSDPTGRNPTSLSPVSGLEVFSDETTTQCRVRGMYSVNDKLYAVADNKFYEVDINGVRHEKGTLTTALNRVKMIDNGYQIGIFDGDVGFVYQLVKTDDREIGDFFQITQTSSVVGDATFTGSGLDDLSTGGTYVGTNDKTYRVEIQETPATPPDKFRWSDTDGSTWNVENIEITAGPYTLNDGVQITFSNTSGHTKDDYWQFDVTTDASFYPPVFPDEQDGIGVFPQQGSTRWYITGINDFSSINALDFAVINSRLGFIQGILSVREELWIFGNHGSRIWYDTGNADFPFEPRTSLLLNFGCAAPHTISKAGNNNILWLSKNHENQLVVVMCAGYNPQVISTEPMNNDFKTYSVVDDAFAFTYQEKGHLMYVLTFPTADKTWVYDLKEKAWHERKSRYVDTVPKVPEYREGRWRANCYAEFFGMNLVGDFESGKIYKMVEDSYEEDGVMMISERTTQHLAHDENRITIEWLQLLFEGGVGLVSGQGSDPTVMLSVSKDGGYTWNGEIWKSLGALGEKQARAKFNRLGYSRTWTLRIRVSDPVYRKLISCPFEMEEYAE
jgi:hypothetical protein